MNWPQLLSNKRLGQEAMHLERKDDRTEFKRDYDRLIFSAPFRRLQNKTQVFPLPGSVFVHNRLTHSLEVASVGRSLGDDVARMLLDRHPELADTHLSEIGSIVSAACLAHDMLEDTADREQAEDRINPEDLPEGSVREAVMLVSKNLWDQSRPDWMDRYYEEIGKNPLACLVKCLDRVNNLAGMADAFDRAKMAEYTAETDRYFPALLEVIASVPEWNDAWWLLRYQMTTLVETFKRML